ncbi:MAG: hypothetical protein U0414_04625 [Polyangiaceae bacterium]
MSPATAPTLTPTTIALVVGIVVLVFAPFIAFALIQSRRSRKKHDENVGSGVYTDAKVVRVERKGTAADLASFRVTLEIPRATRSGAPVDPAAHPPLVLTVRVALPLSELGELQVGNKIPVRFAPPANVEVLLPRGASA